MTSQISVVALRKESVDRNRQNYECFEWIKASLSARRAWIEITQCKLKLSKCTPSLSARRAWIEIIEEVSKYVVKESLSARRAWIEIWLGIA